MLHLRTLSIFAAFFITIIATAQAQVNKISLGQTPGEFIIKSLTLAPGQYQFEILNNGVDHEVGFVLAPKGKTGPEDHIKEAYVTAPVKEGKSSMTKVVSLEAGEYVYFCPLNPTEQYALTVEVPVKKIALEQVVGAFTQKSLTLEAGKYQFAISNNGVDHELGFVLAPKGMTEQKHHIKEAYVTKPVKKGMTSMTKVVDLKAGEYVYFCPLNPTEQYALTVEVPVKKIALEQVVGAFTQKSLTLEAGKYQFAISNNGVDHELGFVLAPKGKTGQKHHIKEAYVTKPVKKGMTSMTKVVDLKAGKYVYFCPLNPTKEYNLTVK